MQVVNIDGKDYVRVSGGDAADASWEAGRIRSMGFSPLIRELEEGHYAIFLSPYEAAAFEKKDWEEQQAYFRSPEGIAEEKYFGQLERDYLRSPDGRLQKHRARLESRHGDPYYEES